MADLYTSLVRAKQELNGGVLPAMTPIPEKLHAIIDPEFTVGMGALLEDQRGLLRCPVRGCGKWFKDLTKHLNKTHPGHGGADGIRRALGIPARVGLIPLAEKAARSARAKISWHNPGSAFGTRRGSAKQCRTIGRRAEGGWATKLSVHHRNFRNTCEAQIGQRILAIRQSLGRDPSPTDVRRLDRGIESAATSLYGSWDAAMAALGIRCVRPGSGRRVGKEHVLTMLRAWVDAHGRLPRKADSCNPNRVPLIPGYQTVLKYLDSETWEQAMDRAATAIGVAYKGGRKLQPRPCALCGAAFKPKSRGVTHCSRKCANVHRAKVA